MMSEFSRQLTSLHVRPRPLLHHEVWPQNQGRHPANKVLFLIPNNLQTDIYTEWRAYYLDYTKLKKYLKDGNKRGPWTQEREDGFIQILEGELEKIQGFQASKVCPIHYPKLSFGLSMNE